MKHIDTARQLAAKMTAIGRSAGRRMAAVLTDMDVPLGCAVGNSLEVAEAVQVLGGEGPADLTEVCLTLAGEMLRLAASMDRDTARRRCKRAIADGSARRKLWEMVTAQGGDASYIENPEKFRKAEWIRTVTSPQDGFLSHMDAAKIGMASSVLGAGREKKGDAIDHSAGILLRKKTGDRVIRGEVLCELHTNREEKLREAEELFLSALVFSEEKPKKPALIYEILD